MAVIVRKERPHPGAQLRLTEADGLRLTCFATNTTDIPIATLELRHRQRARAEDRIRNARATGLRNLPLHDTAQNQIWLEIIELVLDLLAWMSMLGLPGKDRLWSPAACGSASSSPQPGSSLPPADGTYGSPGTGLGPMRSPARSSDSTPSRTPADQQVPFSTTRITLPEP